MTTVGGHKLDQLAINSTTAVAAEVRVNSAFPATAVVEFMAKGLNLYSRTECCSDLNESNAKVVQTYTSGKRDRAP